MGLFKFRLTQKENILIQIEFEMLSLSFEMIIKESPQVIQKPHKGMSLTCEKKVVVRILCGYEFSFEL